MKFILFSYQLSAISYQPSAISYQPLVFSQLHFLRYKVYNQKLAAFFTRIQSPIPSLYHTVYNSTVYNSTISRQSSSRDSNGNPAGSGAIFSWPKRATNGSSFYDIGKKAPQRGIEVDSAIGFKK